MKGSIRFFVGLLITMFAVGGVENSVTDSELMTAIAVALFGLFMMAFGVRAMNGARNG